MPAVIKRLPGVSEILIHCLCVIVWNVCHLPFGARNKSGCGCWSSSSLLHFCFCCNVVEVKSSSNWQGLMYSVCTELYYKDKLYRGLLSCSLNWVFDFSLKIRVSSLSDNYLFPCRTHCRWVSSKTFGFQIKFPSWKHELFYLHVALVSFPAQFPPPVPRVTMAHQTVSVSVVRPDT